MTKRHAPPGRRSNSLNVFVKPLGPHQCARLSGLLNASNTSSRGAANIRVLTISRLAESSVGFMGLVAKSFSFGFRSQVCAAMLGTVSTNDQLTAPGIHLPKA